MNAKEGSLGIKVANRYKSAEVKLLSRRQMVLRGETKNRKEMCKII